MWKHNYWKRITCCFLGLTSQVNRALCCSLTFNKQTYLLIRKHFYHLFDNTGFASKSAFQALSPPCFMLLHHDYRTTCFAKWKSIINVWHSQEIIWLTSVVPTTQQEKIRKTVVQSQPRQEVSGTSSQPISWVTGYGGTHLSPQVKRRHKQDCGPVPPAQIHETLTEK
jgi:hypothetical protein